MILGTDASKLGLSGGDEDLVGFMGGDRAISAILKEENKSHFRGLGGELISTLRLEELRFQVFSKGGRWLIEPHPALLNAAWVGPAQ